MFTIWKSRALVLSLLAVAMALVVHVTAGGKLGIGTEPTRATPARYSTTEELPPGPATGSEYMPLAAGRILTYQTTGGSRFTLTFEAERSVRWFDGRTKQVVPVADSRCYCKYLFTAVNGEVRAVGTAREHWGEYLVVFPGLEGAEADPVSTPAGQFEQAMKVETVNGTVWFAPGVGIVKTAEYVLLSADSYF